MNPLLDALLIPPRLVARALDDLHVIAESATAGLERLEALDARAEAILELGQRIDAHAERILASGERLDARGEEILAQGAAIVELGERMETLVTDATKEAVRVHTRAGEVVMTAQEMIAVLPTLERAVAIAAPLEGLVERMGRMADRLPGGAAPRRDQAPD